MCGQLQAAAAAQTAAKSIVDLKNEDEHGEPSKEKVGDSAEESESEDDNDKLRKSALEKLEKASEDSVFGQASYIRSGLHNEIILSLDGCKSLYFP